MRPVAAHATIQPVSGSRKPVIVRKLSRDWCAGYASTAPAAEDRELELLDTSGKLMLIPWLQIKWVCYVRDLTGVEGPASTHGSDSTRPERILRRRFAARPRISGLWLRLVLADGDELEGVAANDRSLIDGAGLLLTPPDTRSSTLRIFVPRTSIRDFSILAVIGTRPAGSAASEMQPELFADTERV